MGFGHKQTVKGGGREWPGEENGTPKATSQPFKAKLLGLLGSRSPSWLGHPFPGAADHGVLSAAFPEELPVDLKHRKLGEQGWSAQGACEAGKPGPPQVHL